jgi:hypothetical protein
MLSPLPKRNRPCPAFSLSLFFAFVGYPGNLARAGGKDIGVTNPYTPKNHHGNITRTPSHHSEGIGRWRLGVFLLFFVSEKKKTFHVPFLTTIPTVLSSCSMAQISVALNATSSFPRFLQTLIDPPSCSFFWFGLSNWDPTLNRESVRSPNAIP